ncbi:unnamed protein product [Microthlaspi erraticum]|uniref:CBM-cenC domain-containing protein n=1 Tax=Microthlaspi erraticum TaxID=1685480 RepID=A0A6D2I2V8_9BRAS|nr:unnamed protein product [Microthlaspi erraticum]CAA7022757.1 unnamed protein product [Microthlaspi erraticum]
MLKEAFDMFESVKGQGLVVTAKTYNMLIDAYCKSGKIEDGFALKEEMEQLRLLVPNVETYNCLIGGLCRDDQMGEAKKLFVVSSDPFSSDSVSDSSSCGYAVVTNRKDTWQGLEQDITTQVSPGITYTVTASVGVSGPSHESAEILATVRLEHEDSPTEYLFIGK